MPGAVQSPPGALYFRRMKTRCRTACLAVGMGVAFGGLFAGFSRAAPPGWVLQNGAWVPLVPPARGTPAGQVAIMIRELKIGRSAPLIKQAKRWLKLHKKNPLVPQVLLLEGDAQVERGNKYTALFSYEDLLDNFPTTDLYVPTLRREYNIAVAFLKGYKRRFLGLRILPVNGDAIRLLNRIQDRQRGSPLAEQAGIHVANYYYRNGEFRQALSAYTDFLRRYPYSQFAREASIREADSSLANFRGIKFDITPLRDARARFNQIARAYPQTAQTLQVGAVEDRIYQLQGKKDLSIARFYRRVGKKHPAAFYYRRVIANWPDTPYAITAKKELARLLPRKARKSRRRR